MANHQYENINVDLDTHVEYKDVDTAFLGPFKNITHANNCFMALLRLDIALGIVHIRNRKTGELLDTILPGFNGIANFGQPCDIEELWIGVQLNLELTENMTKDQLDAMLLGIYIATAKEEF